MEKMSILDALSILDRNIAESERMMQVRATGATGGGDVPRNEGLRAVRETLLAVPIPCANTEEAYQRLAQEIRRVDGNHQLGAAALAEALLPFLQSHGYAATPAANTRTSISGADAWIMAGGTASGYAAHRADIEATKTQGRRS